jgi:hypothetical protein
MQRDDQDPYASDPTTNASSPGWSTPDSSTAVGNAYQSSLGRSGSQAEYDSWLNDPQYGGNVVAIDKAIYDSPEAQAYRAKSTTPTPPPVTGGNDPGPTTPPPSNTTSTPPPSVAPPAQPSGSSSFHPGTGSTEAEWAISQGLTGGSSAVSGGGNGGAAPTPPSVSTPIDPAVTAYNQSIRNALLSAINSPGVTMDDPDIAPAIQANRVSNQRMLEQQREAIAERLNAQGMSGSGAMDQQMAQAFQQTGEREGTFAGNAVLQQALARRQQLVALLGTGANVLTADEARQAQLKIADLDAYLRQQSITNQNQQSNDQMGLTGAYYQALLKQQQVRDLLGL